MRIATQPGGAVPVLLLLVGHQTEARGEGKIGLRAVAHVTINRVKSPLFPGSICDVVAQGGQNAQSGACQVQLVVRRA